MRTEERNFKFRHAVWYWDFFQKVRIVVEQYIYFHALQFPGGEAIGNRVVGFHKVFFQL